MARQAAGSMNTSLTILLLSLLLLASGSAAQAESLSPQDTPNPNLDLSARSPWGIPYLCIFGSVLISVLIGLYWNLRIRRRDDRILRDSESRYRYADAQASANDSMLDSVFQALPDIFFLMDHDSTILEYRASRDTTLFIPPKKFLNKRMKDLMPPDVGRKLENCMHEIARHGNLRSYEYTLDAPDGPRQYEARLSPLPDSRQIIAIIRDITSRKLVERSLAMREREQTVVAELGQLALTNGNLSELFDTAVAMVADALKVEYCKILEVIPSGEAVLLRAGLGWQEGLVGKAMISVGLNSQAGFTLQSREPVVVEDLTTETRFSGPELLHDHDVISGISVIIGTIDKPWGILGAHSTQPRAFSSDDINFMRSVANLLADTIAHRRAEEALRESEDRFRRLTENARDMIYRMSLPDGRYEYVSPASVEILGYTPESFLDSPKLIIKAIHPEWMDYFQEQWSALLLGDMPPFYEYQIIHGQTGETRWLHQRNVLIRDDEGRPLAIEGIVTDITELKRTELKLRKSEERTRETYDAISDAIFLHPLLQEGFARFVDVNQTACNRYGYTREEFLTLTAGDITGGPDAAIHGEHSRRQNLYQTGRMVFESTHRTKSGETFPVEVKSTVFDLAGQPIILSVARDITERKQASEERVRLTQAIEQASDIVVVTDTSGMILYTNPAFERVSGYTREEAMGQNPRILKSGEHDAAFYKAMWDVLSRGELWHGRIINKKKDGTLYTEEATITPVKDDMGRTVNFVAVKRDITEKLKLEEQIRQSQKVESIGRLAGGVAHDLNNLLAPILGFSEILKDELGQTDPRRETVDEIINAGIRARDLVRQLLAFSRKQTLDYRPLNLNETIRGFEKLLRRTIPENIEIEFTPSPKNHTIEADVGQVEQMIMNLAVNASDAMPQGGRLTIATALVEIDEAYVESHPGSESGTFVMFSMSDTGQGMDIETRSHMFEPFYSTKGDQGTGLGLATVYGIAKQHHGHIMVDSEPGEGTTVSIYLPLSEITLREKSEARISTGHLHGTEVVLLAEDSDQVRQLTQRILERHGYKVLVAETGMKAMEILSTYTGPVHLLLTDVVMPGMNGRALYESVSAKYTELRVLYMSGYTDDVIAHQGVLDEGVHFIQKPFTVTGLAIKVREVLDMD